MAFIGLLERYRANIEWKRIEKSRSHKYIRKYPKKNGKGFGYVYPNSWKHPFKALLDCFGITKKRVADLFERNNIKTEYGCTREIFAAHILEYFTNREKYDKLFANPKAREKTKKPRKSGAGKGGANKNGAGKSGKDKTDRSDKFKPNLSLMRKVWTLFNPQGKQIAEQERKEEKRGGNGNEPPFEFTQELKQNAVSALNNPTEKINYVEYTRENYNKLFPRGECETPIGKVKLGENQFERLASKDGGARTKFLGALQQCLQRPDVIIGKTDNQRRSAKLYLKAFLDNNGKKAYLAVVPTIDGVEVVVSNSPRDTKDIAKEIKKAGQCYYIRPATASSANSGGSQMENSSDGLTSNNSRNEEVKPSDESTLPHEADSVKAKDVCKSFSELKDYAKEKYNLNVSVTTEKVSLEKVLQSFDVVENMCNTFKGLNKYIQNVVYSEPGKGWAGLFSQNPNTGVNTLYIGNVAEKIRENLDGKGRPYSRGKDIKDVTRHELGHALNALMAGEYPEKFGLKDKDSSVRTFFEESRKKVAKFLRGKYSTYDNFLAAANDREKKIFNSHSIFDFGSKNFEKVSKQIVDTALKNIGLNPKRKKHDSFFATDKTEAESAMANISKYALFEDSECIAEAVLDYLSNGEKAQKLSKAIYKIIEDTCGVSQKESEEEAHENRSRAMMGNQNARKDLKEEFKNLADNAGSRTLSFDELVEATKRGTPNRTPENKGYVPPLNESTKEIENRIVDFYAAIKNGDVNGILHLLYIKNGALRQLYRVIVSDYFGGVFLDLNNKFVDHNKKTMNKQEVEAVLHKLFDKNKHNGGGNEPPKNSFSESLDKFVSNGMKGDKPFTVLKDTPAILQKSDSVKEKNRFSDIANNTEKQKQFASECYDELMSKNFDGYVEEAKTQLKSEIARKRDKKKWLKEHGRGLYNNKDEVVDTVQNINLLKLSKKWREHPELHDSAAMDYIRQSTENAVKDLARTEAANQLISELSKAESVKKSWCYFDKRGNLWFSKSALKKRGN